MRIALISDLHGNLVALRSVLAEIRDRGVDRIVCLGDVANLGPSPTETVQVLRDLGCDCIQGNHDAYVLDRELHVEYGDPPMLLEVTDWCRESLSNEDLDFIRSFAKTISIDLGRGSELFLYHGTPRSNSEDLLATTPKERVDEMLAGRRATVMAGGHTHIQMLRQHRGILLVNVGSVGAPFLEVADGTAPTILRHAEYAIVDATAKGVAVGLHRVELNGAELRAAAAACPEPFRSMLQNQYRD